MQWLRSEHRDVSIRASDATNSGLRALEMTPAHFSHNGTFRASDETKYASHKLKSELTPGTQEFRRLLTVFSFYIMDTIKFIGRYAIPYFKNTESRPVAQSAAAGGR